MIRTTRSALTSPRHLALAAALVFGCVAATPSIAAERVIPNKIRVVPDLEVEIWTNKGSNARYCVGETIEIYFRTNVDAWVAVFDTDTRGETHRLFPNRFDHEHFVRGGKTYRLPADGYRFEIEGPAGYETLRVVAAETRRDLRYAIGELIHDRRSRPTRYGDGVRNNRGGYENHFDKIVVVPDGLPDGVAFDRISHRVRDGRSCRAHRYHRNHDDDRRRGYRPWWR